MQVVKIPLRNGFPRLKRLPKKSLIYVPGKEILQTLRVSFLKCVPHQGI